MKNKNKTAAAKVLGEAKNLFISPSPISFQGVNRFAMMFGKFLIEKIIARLNQPKIILTQKATVETFISNKPLRTKTKASGGYRKYNFQPWKSKTPNEKKYRLALPRPEAPNSRRLQGGCERFL
jgi:hypothetical protein